MSDFFSVGELAKKFGLSEGFILRKIKEMNADVIHTGKRFMVPKHEARRIIGERFFDLATFESREAPKVIVSQPAQKKDDAEYYGHVYLLQWQHYYKIGMSIDVRMRVDTLECFPVVMGIAILHQIGARNMRACEAYLHKRFAKYRVRREWFELPPDAVEWICALKDGELDDLRKVVDA